MNVTASCNVCEESFNCAGRKPLVLPCGHTYCLACLTAIETSGDKLCPACRESWDCAAYKLPISYMLIPGSNNEGKHVKKEAKQNYDVCFWHSSLIEYWCCKCQVATCKKCIAEQHYTHGNIVFESLFENEVPISDIKQKFQTDIGSKILTGIKESTVVCEQGLELIKSFKDLELSLQAWKQYLQAQAAHANSCLQAFKRESNSSMKVKMEILAKLMSQCDTRQTEISRQFKLASAMFSNFEAEMELKNQQQAMEKLAMLPQEILPKESTCIIADDDSLRRTLAALENKISVPKCVTIKSSSSGSLADLKELLYKLCEKKCSINLQLLDSFWHGVPSWIDRCRLEPLMNSEHGKCLVSFHGHISDSSTWTQLGTGRLSKLGLRLDSGAALMEVNKILQANFENTSDTGENPGGPFVADICINKTIAANDIQTQINSLNGCVCVRLHVVRLSEEEKSCCSQVVAKLMPSQCYDYRYETYTGQRELWLHECTLSRQGFEVFLSTINLGFQITIYVQQEELTDPDKQRLQNYARNYRCVLNFSIPEL